MVTKATPDVIDLTGLTGPFQVGATFIVNAAGNMGLGTLSPNNTAGYATFTLNGTAGGNIEFGTNGTLTGYVSSTSASLDIGALVGDELRFTSNAIAAARFDTSQRFLIGYTTSQNAACKLQVNSQIFATSATIATSDARVKENVVNLGDGLNVIKALRPVAYDFVEHPVHNFPKARQVGFLAQEVEAAIGHTPYVEGIVDNGGDLKGLAEAKLIPFLVLAIQELEARVAKLEG